MPKPLNYFFYSLSTLFIIIQTAIAATPVVHITPKPVWISKSKPYNKKPAARDIKDGYFCAVLEKQINLEKQAIYRRCINEIVSESGVQDASEISISFDPAYERLDFHNIIVWRNNKPQNRLNAAAFKMLPEEDEMDRFIYNGTYSAKYILPDIRKGDRIEYSYTITGGNPIYKGKFCDNVYFQGQKLVAHNYTSVLFAVARPIHIKSYYLLSQPTISKQNGLTKYVWEDFQVQPLNPDDSEPDWMDPFPHVQITDFSTWKEVVDWGLSINPIQTSFKGDLAVEIDKLKANSGPDKEKYFRNAVTLVQNEVRYMGIETGEYSNRANQPDKVFNQRYGDCKDKSLLLASILNADGIEAHMVLVNTNYKNTLDNFLPSNTLFDHACVVATVNGKQVWVDATLANQGGAGTNIYFPPYGKALVLKAGNTGLTSIPETKGGKIVYNESYNFTDEKSPATLREITTYTGNEADDVRDHLASESQSETEKNYLNYYLGAYPKITLSDSLKIIDHREKNELVTIENYRIKDFLSKDSTSNEYEGYLYSDYIKDLLPNISQQVNTPVAVNYPCTVENIVSVTSPFNWRLDNKHFTINRDAYSFDFDRSVQNQTVTLHYKFSYLKDYISADKLSQLRDDISTIKDDELSFYFYYIPQYKSPAYSLNPWVILLTFIILFAFVYLSIWLLHKDMPQKKPVNRPEPFGFWIILVIINLFAGILYTLYAICKNQYFTTQRWDTYAGQINSVMYHALFITGIINCLIVLFGSVLCLLLIFKKRSIAPRVAIIFYITTRGIVLLYCGLYFFSYHLSFISIFTLLAILSVIKDLAWILYFKRSAKVKQIFVLPYPLQHNHPQPESVSFNTTAQSLPD